MNLKSAWIPDISLIILSGWTDGKCTNSGPPVIFPGELIPELLFVRGKTGAKPVIDRHREKVRRVELKNAAFDLDEPVDLAQIDE